ncbi:MAG: WG repeat-containing protein [Weeksellaceae bacterium]|nr:WG repeat-containing protein [Weeksellaceae bacterium]
MNKIVLFFCLVSFSAISQNNFDKIKDSIKTVRNYEYVYDFENGYAVFRTFDKKAGLVDSIGNEIIKPYYNFIHNKRELENIYEVGHQTKNGYKRGYIDLHSNVRIPVIYENVHYLGNGLIRVSTNNKSGILDTLNNSILPVEYDYIYKKENFLLGRKNKSYEIFDFKGVKKSDIKPVNILYFRNSKAVVDLEDSSSIIIDNKLNIVMNSLQEYQYQRVLENDLYLVKDKKTSKLGVINSLYKIPIECIYDEIIQKGDYYIAEKEDKKGIISSNGSIMKSFVYDNIFYNYSDEAVGYEEGIGENHIASINKLYGVINPFVQEDIIPFNYKSIRGINDEFYVVQDNHNKFGIFDVKGNKILDNEYEFYNIYESNFFAGNDKGNFIISVKDNKVRFTEVNVDRFIPFENMFPVLEKSFYQIFEKDKKFGVLNIYNKVVIPNEYEETINIYDTEEFIVKKNGKYGIVNTNNEVVLDFQYNNFFIQKEVIYFDKNQKIHQVKFAKKMYDYRD